MKKLSLILFITCCIFNQAYSQNTPHTLLWKVTNPKTDKVSYLFATFHQVNPDFFDSLKVADSCLKKSEILFVETYDPNPDTASTRTSLATLAWNKEQWKSVLSPKQLDIFEKFANSEWADQEIYSLSPANFMMVLQYMYFQGICDTVNRKSYDAMDERIVNIGLSNKLKVQGLDKDQLQDLKNSSEKDKALSLKNTIKIDESFITYILEKNTNTKLAKELFNYRDFSLNYSLNKKMNLLKNLLNGRNDKWMKIFIKEFNEKNCFVAVGMRHLFYKTGLIQQLRKEGYKVEPVKLQ